MTLSVSPFENDASFTQGYSPVEVGFGMRNVKRNRLGPVSAVVEGLEDRRLLSSTALSFSGGAGGVSNTGFTGVLPGTNGAISANLALSNGQLLVKTTAGDLTRNNQDDALTLGVDGTTNFTVQTRMRSLAFGANWQNAGIVVGTNQDNYVKIVVGYSGGQMIQLAGEANGTFTSAALDTDDTFSHTFAAPGEYPYIRTIHPYMVGKIIVKPGGSSS